MSREINLQFLRDPVELIRGTPMLINVRPHDTVLKQKDHYRSVASDSRVIYWDVNFDEDDRVFLVTMTSAAPESEENAFPGFWLPWQANETRKITLHDKRAEKTGGAPRAFFTDTLTGCSIFIQGNRMTPTVYHTNARDTSFGSTEVARKAHRAAVQEQRLTRFNPPKRGGGNEHVLHAQDYMIDAHPGAQQRMLEQYRGVGVRAEDVLSRTEAATFFGVRGLASAWTFYAQHYLRLVTQGENRSKVVYGGVTIGEVAPGGVGKPFTSQGGRGTTDIGAAGRTLQWHVKRAISTYNGRWIFNQSDETKTALRWLGTAVNAGYLTLLSFVHYYLGLAPAPQDAIGAPLKTTSSFYADLRAEYEKWLG